MPTKRTTSAPQKKNSMAIYGSIIAFGLVVTIGAVLFGRSDAGQIDVTATISNSNLERIERGEKPVAQLVEAERNKLPNGGLVGKGKSATPQPQPEVEGTSTSTDETASSTDETAEGEGDEDGENAEVTEDTSEEIVEESSESTEEVIEENTETGEATSE